MLAIALVATSCDNEVEGIGRTQIKITDGPIDNAEVEGVFVTITDVKIDGESAPSFSGPQTINLMALQNGRTELLVDEGFGATTYNSIEFQLDLVNDANGTSPGCYVLTDQGKEALEMDGQATADIAVRKTFEVVAGGYNAYVVDFDLRKMITQESGGALSPNDYSFATESETEAALRLVSEANTGTIAGEIDDSSYEGADKVVVYAYKKGEFDPNEETTGGPESQFRNAVNSVAVARGWFENGFELNFMEAGEYELVFASYSENSTTNQAQFEGLIATDLRIDGQLINTVMVEAEAQLEISASLTTILGR